MMTREAVRQRFMDQICETSDGFTAYTAPCGVSVGVSRQTLEAGIPADLNQTLASFGYGLAEPKAIDWTALITALAPLFTQSLTPKSTEEDEKCYSYEGADGSYCIIPKSFMDRCETDEGKLCVAAAVKVLTGREAGGAIMALILKMLPVILPVVLPLIIGGCA